MKFDDRDDDVNRPSGLPRPSRLPLLRSKASQPALIRPKEVPTDGTGIHAIPKLQKRSSVATFPRSDQINSKGPVLDTVRPKPRVGNISGSKYTIKASASTSQSRPFAVRPSSRGNQQRLPPCAPKPVALLDDEENHDQLSSLDGFRAASRQGSHEDTQADPLLYSNGQDVTASALEAKSSRLSLSDRTMESISGLPSTPKERRRSSFFSPVRSPMGPPPRPSSSTSRNGSNVGSRPGTSDSSVAAALDVRRVAPKRAPTSAKPAIRTSLGGFGFTPAGTSRRSVSSTTYVRKAQSRDHTPPRSRSPSPSRRVKTGTSNFGSIRGSSRGSKSLATRPAKPRPPLTNTFDPVINVSEVHRVDKNVNGILTSTSTPVTAKDALPGATNDSSAALRRQIAAARAAARRQQAPEVGLQHKGESPHGLVDTNQADPFNQMPVDSKHVLRSRINAARMEGKLNIAALELKHFPEEVLRMYSSAAIEESKVSWAEVVDLTRLIVADNDIEEIAEDVFPDKTAEDFQKDDLTEGNQFGGLEMLDMHGNQMRALPQGLRQLERLTSLNLAHNNLDNECLGIVAQISSLKDLRLGHNSLSGTWPSSACGFAQLETLDIQANRLLGLSEALRELESLKFLNVAGNQLTALPMEALQSLPLIELDASRNALIGSLFPTTATTGHPRLQRLKISNNSLAALTFTESLDLPCLRELEVTNNHLTALPPVSAWMELITLTAGDNKIAELPVGFTTLTKLRNVNLSGNDLRLLDPQIARMDSLETLIIASNPLRERKLLTMNAGDIKRELGARLGPVNDDLVNAPQLAENNAGEDDLLSSISTPSATWTLKGQGTLDLAGRGYSDSINDSLGSFLRSNEVKQLQLSANLLTAVPPALWLGQDLRILDLSGNSLSSDYIFDELSLPALQELSLSRCNISSVEIFVMQLVAPRLHTLDISANRVTGAVPTFRQTFPALTTLLANDNRFTSVTADALRGMKTVNLRSNCIEQLPAEIGLLWDEGLRSLDVSCNAFRVPNFRTLEKGTDTLMKWLRDRIPAT